MSTKTPHDNQWEIHFLQKQLESTAKMAENMQSGVEESMALAGQIAQSFETVQNAATQNAQNILQLDERVEALEENAGSSDALLQLETQVEANKQTIAALNQKIHQLQDSLANNTPPPTTKMGYSVAEISALFDDVMTEENFCTSAKQKIIFSSRLLEAHVPHARVFFRHNPLKTGTYFVSLKMFVEPIPEGLLQTNCTFALNGVLLQQGTINLVSGQEHQFEAQFAIDPSVHSLKVFNILDISFLDEANIGTAFLDFVEIEITQSQNCMILNRDTRHEINGYMNTDGLYELVDRCFLSGGRNRGYVIDRLADFDWADATYTTIYYSIIDDCYVCYSYRYPYFYYNPKTKKYENWHYFVGVLMAQNGFVYSLCSYNQGAGLRYNLTNVMTIKTSFHNGEDFNHCYLCLIMKDFEPKAADGYFLSGSMQTYLQLCDVTLGSVLLPKEFVDFAPVKDFWITHRTGKHTVGYFLLHQSGNILFVPHFASTYFLHIGTGQQINAFYMQDETIEVTYQFNKNVIKKTLAKNQEGIWEIVDTKYFLNIDEYYICANKKYTIKDGEIFEVEE